MTFRSLFALLIALSLTLGLAAGPAIAQTPPSAEEAAPAESTAIDYDAWAADATRAENLVDAATASNAFFTNVREKLVEWRTQFQAAQDANSARIETIEAQIEGLGPPPAEGETEPEAIAQRRTALNARLAEAQVPRVTATEAFNQADGLIREVDALLDDRRARALLERDPAPLNPLNWRTALVALADTTVALDGEIRQHVQLRIGSGENWWDSTPFAGGLLLLALLLLTRSRYFVGRWTERMQLQVASRRGRGALAFVISLLQVLLPVTGLVLIRVALGVVDLIGPTGLALIQSTIYIFIAVYLALWLAGRLFPANPELKAAFGVEPEARAPIRRYMLFAAIFVGLGNLTETLAGLDTVPPAARGVFVLPVYVGLALSLLRLLSLFRAASLMHRQGSSGAGASVAEADTEVGFVERVLFVIGMAVRVAAFVGPALGAVGYLNLAEGIMVPTALTLGLIGLIAALQSPIDDTYALISGRTHEEAAEALVPVLVNLLLVFAALPVLGLIWGMRVDQLAEIYTRFLEGFDLGGVRITPAMILAVLAVFAIGMIATRMLQGALRSAVLPRTKLDVGSRNAVLSGIGYVGIALSALIAITAAGINLTALGVLVGALSVGIGFGLQNVVNNFVSGIILLIERPISEGDWIEVGPTMGIVKTISVRSTTIETFDKTDVIVPNADLISGTVTNWTRGNTIGRAIVTVGVAYGTDTRRVTEILREIAMAQPHVAKYPEPGIDFLGFGADSLDFRMRMILRDVNNLLVVKNEVHHQIAERFKAEGIEIPFAQRDIWLRNPEALRAPPAAEPQALPPTPASDKDQPA
jgi:small-conductance mechanosensitive channel